MIKLYKNKLLIIEGTFNLPIGKVINRKGRDFTVLPWRLSTYLMCNRIAIPNLPSPSSGYDFTRTPYRPYEHQRITVDFFLTNHRAFCWNEAGTGKTASCLWAYDMLRRNRLVQKILVVCPLSTSQTVWGHEMFSMLPQIKHGLLTGSRERRIKLLDKGLDAYIINHDGIKTMLRELLEWGPELIIVDEHTAFKNKSSARWKALSTITAKARNVWMLSGTPAPQAPTDLYAPARIICPDLVGRSMVRFRDLTMIQVGMYKWLPRPNFQDILKGVIKPVIRFSRDDCLDLPDIIYQTYNIELSKKQKTTFDKLRKDAMLKIDDGIITALNEGVMRNKLLQCCSGYVYDQEHNTIDINPKDRIEALRDLIQESSRGVLVFMSFRNSVNNIEKILKKDFSIRSIHGGVGLAKRTKYFREFQEGKIKVLIAHPKTMGHGITLTEADTVIWYLVTSDAELYEQANSRIRRIGQTHKMRVIHLLSTTLEKQILVRLKEKRSMQGVLLETLGKE